MLKLSLIVVCGLFLCQISLGQRLRFSQITIKDGLSQSTINDVIQDNEGYIWIATEDGLNRYDGISMTVFNDDTDRPPKMRLSGREINCLFKDRMGHLWIGTASGGINVYKGIEGFVKIQNDSIDHKSLISNNINSIDYYDESHLLVSTSEGLDKVNIETFQVTHLLSEVNAHDIKLNIKQALKIENDVWVASHGSGLVRFKINSELHEVIVPKDSSGSLLKKNADKVRCLFLDSKRRFWIGFYGAGLATFNPVKKTFDFKDEAQNFSAKKVSFIYEDHEHVNWVGTDKGIARFDESKNQFRFSQANEEDGLSVADDNIISLWEDEANSLWFGTQLGLSVYHRTLGKFNHVKKDKGSELSLELSKKVFAFEEDDNGNIWVGTDGGGLVKFDFRLDEVVNYTKEINGTHNTVLAIKKSVDNKIWFGTLGGGINYYDLTKDEFGEKISRENGLPSSSILSLEEDKFGNLLIGTFKGLVYFDRVHDTLIVFDSKTALKGNGGNEQYLPSDVILDIAIINKKIWLGTSNGLCLIDVHKRTLDVIDQEDGLSNNEVYSIQGIGKDIWIGTKNGLNKYDVSTNEITTYTKRDGLQSNFIYGVLIDEEKALWLSTNNGLTKFNPYKTNNNGNVYVRHYNEVDGLQADEFNQGAYFKSSKGEMFFGGVNGFNHFNPQAVRDNDHQTKVVLRTFKIFNHSINLDSAMAGGDVLELSYKDNYLEFEFAGLDFVLPEKNLYSYMLVGVDDDWSKPSTRNYASYKDLAGGDYILKIKASNNDGVWSEHIFVLKIHIEPPFWKTTWFYVLCVIGIALGIFVFVRLRMSKIKREKKILEQKVKERTHELAAKTEELAEKNQDIMDSINYAQKIQTAILPNDKMLDTHLKDMFVLFLPKDIVSGDFYWFGVKDNLKVITAVDCTGHGVPGAFMSMIGSNLLNQIVLEKGITKSGEILKNLNLGVQNSLKQGTDAQETNDGMDISLCTIDQDNLKLQWAGAYNPLFLIRDGEIIQYKANKYPIGGAHMEMDREYETHEIDLQKGDALYMFSDGFVDQFGGPKGKKFMGKRFKALLLETQHLSMKEQQIKLHEALKRWMQSYEQVDDICVIGVRV